jgi:hypothetical protein
MAGFTDKFSSSGIVVVAFGVEGERCYVMLCYVNAVRKMAIVCQSVSSFSCWKLELVKIEQKKEGIKKTAEQILEKSTTVLFDTTYVRYL